MVLDPKLRNQAYQLFIQEALELSQQLDAGLQDLYDDPSLTKVEQLVQVVQTIATGVTQLHLTDLQPLTHRVETTLVSLQQDPGHIAPHQVVLLQQACAELQQSLQTLDPSAPTLALVDIVVPQLTAETATTNANVNQGTEELTVDEWEANPAESILRQDMAEILERLNVIVATPEMANRSDLCKEQIEAVLSWGEVLDQAEWVTIAQATLALLNATPEQTQTIAQLALSSLQTLHKLALIENGPTHEALAKNRRTGHSTLTQNPSALRSPPSPNLHPLPTVIKPTSLATSKAAAVSGQQIPAGQRLKTSKLFVWATGEFIFTLPSEAVAEILIPNPAQVVPMGQNRGLRWQNQTIPIYSLVQLLRDSQPLPEGKLRASVETLLDSKPEIATLLVVQQGEQRLALDIVIESLITDPELLIKRFAGKEHLPSYYWGTTLRADQHWATVINVIMLLTSILYSRQVTPSSLLHTPDIGGQDQQVTVPPPPSSTGSTATVMVVDDSQTLRRILGRTLQKSKYQVLEAQDGQEALTLLQKNPAVQLVICDIEMPNMNGFEFLSHCRRDQQFAQLPVVMLSTFSSDQHHDLARKLGANAYFGKPYDETEFLKTLRSLIS